MKRKLFAALLAVMMVFAIVPVSVSAAPVEVSTAAGLVENAALEDAIIVLTADIELTETLMVTKVLSIDLNGHTISGNFESERGTVYVGVNGELHLSDSSEAGTGKITSSKSYAIGNYGEVNIYGGTYESTAEDCAALYNFFYDGNTYGLTDIYAGTFSEIWNCGEIYIEGADIGTLDNSGYVELWHDISIDLFIDREGVADGYESMIDYIFIYCADIVIKKAIDEEGNEIDFEKKYAPEFLVELELDGGTCEIPENLSVALCDDFDALPTPTKEGFVFKGWAIKCDPNNTQPEPCLLTVNEEETPVEEETGITYLPISEMNNAAHLTKEMVYIEYNENDEITYIVLKALWEEEPVIEVKPEEIVPVFENPLPFVYGVQVETTEGGKTDTTSKFVIAKGASRTIKLIPEEGYEVAEVRINNIPVEVKNNTVSIRGARSNYLVKVTFAEVEVPAIAAE